MSIQSPTKVLKEDLKTKLLQPDYITGSDILLRCLLLEGVDCVFGYPGGAVLYIYNAMHGNPDFHHLLHVMNKALFMQQTAMRAQQVK
jgi:acetolactate synthase-1/2/3 large subunit